MRAIAGRNKVRESALPILAIILLATVAQIFILRAYHPIWWDQAVYAGMGKFIFSAGKSGIWEPLRPPVLPLLIGLFWKIGMDAVLAGRILSTLFSIGIITLVYFIAKKVFNYRTAVIASFLTAFSHLFLFYNHVGLSEMPSAFFALLGVLMVVEEKYFWAGVFSSFSFLSKFPGGIVFGSAAIFIAFLQLEKIKEKAKRILLLSIGFFLPVAIFLIANRIMYGNVFLPFADANLAIASTFPKSPLWFYFLRIVIENMTSIFAIAYFTLLIFRKEKNNNAPLICIAAALFIAYFSILGYKEMRFAILFIPLVNMLSAAGISGMLKKAKLIMLVLLVFSAQSVFFLSVYSKNWERKSPDSTLKDFYSSVSGKSGEIWVSDPQFSVYTDAVLHLLYYPTFEEASKQIKLENASFVFLNTCDLVCRDEECEKRKSALIEYLENSFNKSETSSSSCRLLIFSR